MKLSAMQLIDNDEIDQLIELFPEKLPEFLVCLLPHLLNTADFKKTFTGIFWSSKRILFGAKMREGYQIVDYFFPVCPFLIGNV